MPQLPKMAIHRGNDGNRKWPYQAVVIKTFDKKSSPTAF